jgi:hypothetical protein
MPIWYALCLVLLIVEAYVRRNRPHVHLLYGAVILWGAAIVYTVSTLVPINNRIARLDLASLPAGWSQEHRRWQGRGAQADPARAPETMFFGLGVFGSSIGRNIKSWLVI